MATSKKAIDSMRKIDQSSDTSLSLSNSNSDFQQNRPNTHNKSDLHNNTATTAHNYHTTTPYGGSMDLDSTTSSFSDIRPENRDRVRAGVSSWSKGKKNVSVPREKKMQFKVKDEVWYDGDEGIEGNEKNNEVDGNEDITKDTEEERKEVRENEKGDEEDEDEDEDESEDENDDDSITDIKGSRPIRFQLTSRILDSTATRAVMAVDFDSSMESFSNARTVPTARTERTKGMESVGAKRYGGSTVRAPHAQSSQSNHTKSSLRSNPARYSSMEADSNSGSGSDNDNDDNGSDDVSGNGSDSGSDRKGKVKGKREIVPRYREVPHAGSRLISNSTISDQKTRREREDQRTFFNEEVIPREENLSVFSNSTSNSTSSSLVSVDTGSEASSRSSSSSGSSSGSRSSSRSSDSSSSSARMKNQSTYSTHSSESENSEKRIKRKIKEIRKIGRSKKGMEEKDDESSSESSDDDRRKEVEKGSASDDESEEDANSSEHEKENEHNENDNNENRTEINRNNDGKERKSRNKNKFDSVDKGKIPLRLWQPN